MGKYIETGLVIVFIIILIVLIATLSKNKIPNVFEEYYYFDSNATTPMSPETINQLNAAVWLGNASTDYAKHNGASDVITNTSNTIRKILNAPDYEVCFNSGASEGNCYVFQTMADYCAMYEPGIIPHIIISEIEHKSVLKCCESLVKLGRIEVTVISPIIDGCIDPVSVAEHCQPNTRLISIMHANNEIGSINNLVEIGKVARAYSVLFHSDIAQSFCKLNVDMQECCLDIVTISMHKVYGPLGMGAIVLSPRVASWKLAQISGTQFNGLRGGTENLASIAACQSAMTSTITNRHIKNAQLRKYKQRVLNALTLTFGAASHLHEFYGKSDEYIPLDPESSKESISFLVLGQSEHTLPGTLLISLFKVGNYDLTDRFCNIILKEALFKKKIIISIGSACNTKLTGPSHVLVALKAPFVIRSGVIRISFLDSCTQGKVDYLIKNLIEAVKEQCLRRL